MYSLLDVRTIGNYNQGKYISNKLQHFDNLNSKSDW